MKEDRDIADSFFGNCRRTGDYLVYSAFCKGAHKASTYSHAESISSAKTERRSDRREGYHS